MGVEKRLRILLGDQPPMELERRLRVLAAVTDEQDGHVTLPGARPRGMAPRGRGPGNIAVVAALPIGRCRPYDHVGAASSAR